MKPENCSALNKMCLCDVCILSSIKNDDNVQPKLLCSDCCSNWNHSQFDDDETALNRICKKHHLDYDEHLRIYIGRSLTVIVRKSTRLMKKLTTRMSTKRNQKRIWI